MNRHLITILLTAAVAVMTTVPSFAKKVKPEALKTENLTFSINSDATSAGFIVNENPDAALLDSDFWRLVLDDGHYIEIPVLSKNQKGRVSTKGNVMTVEYDQLVSEYGKTYPVYFKITIEKEDSGLLRFTPYIENNDTEVRVNECFCPVADFKEVVGERKDDALYWPAGLGRRFKNPWKMMYDRAHTQAQGSRNWDEVFLDMVYPRASMSWFGIQSADKFLYISREDKDMHQCLLTVRQRFREEKPNLMLGIDHYPMVRPGEKLQIPSSVIGLLDGDWRKGAKTYRAYADANFFKVQPKADWVKNMKGWHRLSLRGQDGDVRYRFDELPRLWKETEAAGLGALFLFGWWKEGMDRGYPDYNEAYPGAYKELAENIKKVQDMGGHVILVSNAHFIDPQSEFYKTGKDCGIRDYYGNEYFASFGYAGIGEFHVKLAPVKFVVTCFGSEKWRDQVYSQMEFTGSTLGADCVFPDCIGGCPWNPCFNHDHDHGCRVDEGWKGQRQFFQKTMDYTYANNKVLGTEILTDIAASYTQFVHTLINGEFHVDDASSYPALWRYTYPEVITSLRKIQVPDPKGRFRKQFKYALTQGVRVDACLFGCRRSIATEPEYAEMVKFYTDHLEKYREFYLDGSYTVIDDSPLPRHIKRGEYYNADKSKVMKVTYNAKTDELKFDIFDASTYMK